MTRRIVGGGGAREFEVEVLALRSIAADADVCQNVIWSGIRLEVDTRGARVGSNKRGGKIVIVLKPVGRGVSRNGFAAHGEGRNGQKASSTARQFELVGRVRGCANPKTDQPAPSGGVTGSIHGKQPA